MRSTFNILFYVNKSKERNGVVPVMGHVTINGTQSQFSSKKSIPLNLWNVKGNCAKGRSKEALQINRELDNIKAQIIKHYQHLLHALQHSLHTSIVWHDQFVHIPPPFR